MPSGWAVCRLEKLCCIQTGKKDANYGSPEGKYAFFTCSMTPIRCDDYSFEGDCIILPGNGANVGKILRYNGKFEAYQRTYVLNPIGVNNDYFHTALLSLWQKSLEGK
ncbi:restriction endonuclease subunit S, partial [Pasteurellaceae bacterium 20609_3]|uniref:restriction endonuclease subunit S n=1 Tax=Spirabiliibacterium mucosae TaxID=28156 RepID=UPI001AAD6DCD